MLQSQEAPLELQVSCRSGEDRDVHLPRSCFPLDVHAGDGGSAEEKNAAGEGAFQRLC